MKNNISYYRHEVESHNHWKFKTLRRKYGWAGEGKFWALNNIIADSENCLLNINDQNRMECLAADIDFDLDELMEFIDFLIQKVRLVILNDSFITTGIVQEVLVDVTKKREYQKNWVRKANTPEKQNDKKVNIDKIQEKSAESQTNIENADLNLLNIENEKINSKSDNSNIEKIQSKVKESKVKNIIDKSIILDSSSVENISTAKDEDIISPKKEKAISAEGKKYAEHFKSLLPKSQKITEAMFISWAETFDELIRIDGRDSPEIYQVTKWARQDSFWSDNFLSATKLRKKNRDGAYYYDVLLNKMRGQNNGKHGKDYSVPEYDPDSDW